MSKAPNVCVSLSVCPALHVAGNSCSWPCCQEYAPFLVLSCISNIKIGLFMFWVFHIIDEESQQQFYHKPWALGRVLKLLNLSSVNSEQMPASPLC